MEGERRPVKIYDQTVGEREIVAGGKRKRKEERVDRDKEKSCIGFNLHAVQYSNTARYTSILAFVALKVFGTCQLFLNVFWSIRMFTRTYVPLVRTDR